MKNAIKTKGRKPNPAWEGVFRFGGQMFKNKTDGEIQKYLEEKGFKTSVVNVYLMRQRWKAKGKNVVCSRSRILKPAKVEINQDFAEKTENPETPENE